MEDLSGVWGSDLTLGPELRGELVISRDGPGWRATISGFDSACRQTDGELRFLFPGSRGEFRGKQSGDRIEGHWIQPPGPVNGYSYATPVELAPEEGGVWHGQVTPLDERIAAYLVLERQPDGTIMAFVRDPLTNAGAGLGLGAVSTRGSEVRIESRRYGEITGEYDAERGTLSFMFPRYPVALDFTRRGRGEAAGFYPRPPLPDRYGYNPPLPENDGWPSASPAEVGLDLEPLTSLVEQILRTEARGVTAPYIQALLVARHGKLVLEEYFYGSHRDSPHDMRSATKSLTAALAGAAIDRGAPLSLDTPVCSLFPQYAGYTHDDARKRRITIGHLLTMSSGLDCDDDDDASPGNEDNMQGQAEQPDWYKYALDLPMLHEPGEQAVYCSAGMNLLGGAVAGATGIWLPELFREAFAVPLGFGRYHLQLTRLYPNNVYGGGGGYMRPRDFMKLGQVFLDGGRWGGQHILSQEWAEASWQPHSHLQGHDYGYGWHLGEYRVGGRTYRRVEAGGNGGQLLIAVPELDLLVMFTGANYGDYRTWSKFRDDLVPEFILPAVRS